MRRFRIALLPEAIPAFTEVGVRLNPELRGIPEAIRAVLPGVEIALSNWGPHFDEVMRKPGGVRHSEYEGQVRGAGRRRTRRRELRREREGGQHTAPIPLGGSVANSQSAASPVSRNRCD